MASAGVLLSISSERTAIVDRYRLEHRLGEGGMGVVWRATRLEDGVAVAIKLVKKAGSEAMQKRLLREARAASAVRHPNIVRLHEVLEIEGAPALVMELLHGESLAQRLARDGALDPTEAAGFLMAAVSAVGTLHARGIVHRDLKPANIFLAQEEGGTVLKVLDFGIAKWTIIDEEVAAETGGLTASGALVGTPCYMSPEQAFGEKDIDHRSDIWSLGIIAYQCLSGVLPTRADNVGQVLKIVLTGRIPAIGTVAPSVPKSFQQLITRMLSVSRKDRPKDLRDVQSALKELTDTPALPFGPPAQPPHLPEDEVPTIGDAPGGDTETFNSTTSRGITPASLLSSTRRTSLADAKWPVRGVVAAAALAALAAIAWFVGPWSAARSAVATRGQAPAAASEHSPPHPVLAEVLSASVVATATSIGGATASSAPTAAPSGRPLMEQRTQLTAGSATSTIRAAVTAPPRIAPSAMSWPSQFGP